MGLAPAPSTSPAVTPVAVWVPLFFELSTCYTVTMKAAEKSTKRNGNWLVFCQTEIYYALAFATLYGITAPFLRPATQAVESYQATTPNTTGGFLLIFGIATVAAVLLVQYVSDKRFWPIFFGGAAFAGIFITIYYPFALVFSTGPATVIAAFLAVALLVLRVSQKTIWLHNVVILLAVVGVARLFGTNFTPQTTISILIILAVYDIIAVYFSKHMIKMAVTLFKRDAFFGAVFPRQLIGWKTRLTDATLQEDITVVGGGDLAFPLFFALTVLIHFGHTAFFIVAGATGVGVLAMHLLYTYPITKRPIPGLPPLVLACVGANYLVIWLLTTGLIR